MDVTHIPPFGKLSFVHICVDTLSGLLFANAGTGEAFKDVFQQPFAAFAFMGMPKLKTDNGPAYTSKSFAPFCAQFSLQHATGIPYNPQGQAIIERPNQLLKTQIQK